jgi:outer membrane immunogenic protein
VPQNRKGNLKMRTTFATLALAGLSAAPALAGGLNTPVTEPTVVAAPMVAATRPDGDWGGFYAGASIGYGDVGASGSIANGNGLIGGVHAGYRWDLGTPVFGIEGEYQGADISLGKGDDSVDSVARVKLIGGADLGRTFIYATAGAAYGEATVGGDSTHENGYFGGVGLDYKVTDQWILGGEVLSNHFDNVNSAGDLNATTASLRVSYQF